MSEREDLERAIIALEAQRAALGDAVVDAAIATLRERLAALTGLSDRVPQTFPSEQRKQVTVLFAEVAGLIAAAEALGPEKGPALVDALWQRLDRAITAHGGTIDKHIGDTVMALWGVEQAREDDPERAIRGALAMQKEMGQEGGEQLPVPLSLRVGINTGPVLLGRVGSTAEFTAMGDTVNVASRLQNAAPFGTVLISHDTYRHVRGLFDVLPQAPLMVKGKAEPLQTYIVRQAKPRGFRLSARGVEGIETHTIGRQAELAVLQEAFRTAVGKGQTRAVTLVGEAGVGKSRLLYEFEDWLELQPEEVRYFKGRSTPETIHLPYGLLRNLIGYHCDILDSDSAAVVREKFMAGMSPYLEPARAPLVGQLIGFDFSTVAAIGDLLGNPSLVSLALAEMVRYFRLFTADHPTVLFLEDLHWADNPSLDLIAHLMEKVRDGHLLIVSLARPTLYERRPLWPAAETPLETPTRSPGRPSTHTRLDLPPLSPEDSRRLVGEILQKVENLPEDLRELVVRSAEGNPFYIEELIKMLIEDGVVVRGEQRWWVELERMKQARVPPTLTGVLQARLDSLPPKEKETLQRASVVGRLFWDATVAELRTAPEPEGAVVEELESLRRRELIFRRERSAFAGSREYIFKHALLRDVTYETVLLKLRRVYHRQVARWLEAHSGERLNEYAGLIADHYERAEAREEAALWLGRAAEAALASGAFREARDALGRALALTAEEDRAARATLLVRIGKAHDRLGDYPAAQEYFQAGLSLAREAGDLKTMAYALDGLCWVATVQGALDKARSIAEEALEVARAAGDQAALGRALMNLAGFQKDHAAAMGYYQDSLAILQEVGDRNGAATCLLNMGNAVYLQQDDLPLAGRYYQDSLALFREAGNRWGIANCLANLGLIAEEQGNCPTAIRCYTESLAISRDIGDREGIAICLGHLGDVSIKMGDYAAAKRYLGEALAEALEIGAAPIALANLASLANLHMQTGRPVRAAEWLGLVVGHPAYSLEVIRSAEPFLAALRAALPEEELAAAMERGKALNLETVVREVLAETAESKGQEAES